jgi:hypothetical protein
LNPDRKNKKRAASRFWIFVSQITWRIFDKERGVSVYGKECQEIKLSL